MALDIDGSRETTRVGDGGSDLVETSRNITERVIAHPRELYRIILIKIVYLE